MARWLSGELEPEELQALEKSEDFGDYVEIVAGMDRFIKPTFTGEALGEKIRAKIAAPKKSKVIRFRPWHYAVAASILVLFSSVLFFSEMSYTTLPGQQTTVLLPDGTRVRLNADTQLKRARFFWSSDRTVQLVGGEAFFEVERGTDFEVTSPEGSIHVLGTKFNVKSREGHFEVGCFQGKVQVVAGETGAKAVLTKGQRVRGTGQGLESGTLKGQRPPWMKGESVFENVPLKVVLSDLEAQYGITMDAKGIHLDEKYTGGFVHGNLDRALTTVLLPMGIEFRIAADSTTVVLTPMD